MPENLRAVLTDAFMPVLSSFFLLSVSFFLVLSADPPHPMNFLCLRESTTIIYRDGKKSSAEDLNVTNSGHNILGDLIVSDDLN